MQLQRTVVAATLLLHALPIWAVAQAADSIPFHFWFQRDGACVACAQMPPPTAPASFPQQAGIDVMFNGFNQTTRRHWHNPRVESYQVTYTYKLNGTNHSATATASGDAASVVIKPYAAADINKASIVSISVTATYSSGPVTKTVPSPEPFKVY